MGFKDSEQFANFDKFRMLKENGEQLTGVLIGEPSPRHTTYLGKKRTSFLFPIFTENGIEVFPANVTTYRQLRDSWGDYYGKAITITRNGRKGDTDTHYTIEPAKKPHAELLANAGKVNDMEVSKIVHLLVNAPDLDNSSPV